ncbi:MAG: hypothetical protein Q3M30_16810 [Candidatus Electrothrix sp. Rat3]|nr:hypothetical protein [Candidatus Electrothrix rattekaaiensis]
MKSETDWQRVDAISDETITEIVDTDPDARLLDANDFKKMRGRIPQKVPLKKPVTSTPSLDHRSITPNDQTQDDWFDAPEVSDDFMEKREQPDDQLRDTL